MRTTNRALPHQSKGVFLTDGGLETTLIFHKEMELPQFAAFPLVDCEEGSKILLDYFRDYIDIAHSANLGFILESPTWRANPDWAKLVGYDESALKEVNQKAVHALCSLRDEYSNNEKILVSGCIGPRGDGYVVTDAMTIEQAEQYHSQQLASFSDTQLDLVNAMTMTYVEEAIGIVKAAQKHELPVVISFTTETDGRLPSGMSLQEAIELVDEATHSGPVYYCINCAHPTHFAEAIDSDKPWVKRIRGLRANASCMSHAELDECEHLDDGDPVDFAKQYALIHQGLGDVNVFGGCCGTDTRHISEVAALY